MIFYIILIITTWISSINELTSVSESVELVNEFTTTKKISVGRHTIAAGTKIPPLRRHGIRIFITDRKPVIKWNYNHGFISIDYLKDGSEFQRSIHSAAKLENSAGLRFVYK